jgi:HK97 family phage portal protein
MSVKTWVQAKAKELLLKDLKIEDVFPRGQPSFSGEHVTQENAMRATAVYACVRILAESVAGLPLHVYRRKENGGKERDKSHPLYALLHDAPNPEMTSFVFRETLMSHLALWGNAYAQIIRDGTGTVRGLYPLLPQNMRVWRDENGELRYDYRSSKNGGITPLKRYDVLHIPGISFDGLKGLSPIDLAKNAIGVSISTERYGAKFFENDASPGGVLTHPGKINDPDKLKASWKDLYSGSKNATNPSHSAFEYNVWERICKH